MVIFKSKNYGDGHCIRTWTVKTQSFFECLQVLYVQLKFIIKQHWFSNSVAIFNFPFSENAAWV